MSVTLLQISDIHFAAGGGTVDGRDPASRLRCVLEAVASSETSIDALVLTGDLTDDGTWSACHDLAEALRGLELPTLAVPGNHDDPAAVRSTFGLDVLEAGGWRVMGVDTSRPDQIHGTVDVGEQLGRLDGWDNRWTVLAMHHPPVSPSTNAWFQLEGADEFKASLAIRPHVRAVLSGHLHFPFELAAGGTPVLGGPSSLIAFKHEGDEVLIGGSDATGARICALNDDGTVSSRLVVA